MKRTITALARAVLRSRFLVVPVAYFISCRLTYLDRAGSIQSGAKRKVIALNGERYRPDLRKINRQGEFQVMLLDNRLQSYINAFYLGGATGRKMAEKGTRNFLKSDDPDAVSVVRAQEEYLSRFIPVLMKFSGAEALLTCTFYYAQDQLWMSGAEEASVPFLVLHKECMKDTAIISEMTRQYKHGELYFRFRGSRMAVYNQNEKTCQVDGDVAAENAVVITGCPRMDDLFQQRLADSFRAPEKCVTFFSFRHIIGGLRDPDMKKGFSSDGSNGAVKLFAFSHVAFAETALRNPDWEFVIKPKWLGEWGAFIEAVIQEHLGRKIADIPNLKLSIDEPALSLIERSKVIVGLNSTTIVEARIAKRDVVIPLYEEAEGRHKDRIYFRKHFDKNFLVAHSPQKQIELTEKAMFAENNLLANQDESLFEEFFGYTDGKSTERVVDFIRTEIEQKSAVRAQ